MLDIIPAPERATERRPRWSPEERVIAFLTLICLLGLVLVLAGAR